MPSPLDILPLSSVAEPASSAELADIVRSCQESDVAVYPLGGRTSLDFGWPPRKPGMGLSLANLNRVVDYPARDLTITVESGVTMQTLAELLAKERQRLPLDVPSADRATIGGVVVTNTNGPRRYGCGSVRDYVIGISAVDGRGTPFKGGGRVVKNVAGYDFCKLLTGSLGTLGVVTQLTMRLQPIPELLAVVVTSPANLVAAETLMAQLVHSRSTPTAVQLLVGKIWADDPAFAALNRGGGGRPLFLAVAVEGSAAEVQWMTEQLRKEWWQQGSSEHDTLLAADAHRLFARCVEFPVAGKSPLVLKASVLPSRVTALIDSVLRFDPDCSVQAQAGNGVVQLRMSQLPPGGMTKGLIGTLQSAAVAAGGSLVVLSAESTADATHQSIWGPPSSPQALMTAVKRAFDPRNILNPDRFVYAGY